MLKRRFGTMGSLETAPTLFEGYFVQERTATLVFRLHPSNLAVLTEPLLETRIRALRNVLGAENAWEFFVTDLPENAGLLRNLLEEKWRSEKNEAVRRYLVREMKEARRLEEGGAYERAYFLLVRLSTAEEETLKQRRMAVLRLIGTPPLGAVSASEAEIRRLLYAYYRREVPPKKAIEPVWMTGEWET